MTVQEHPRVSGEVRRTVRTAILRELARTLRETDSIGVYGTPACAAAIFSEFGRETCPQALLRIQERVKNAIASIEGGAGSQEFKAKFRIFPDDVNQSKRQRVLDLTLYPDLVERQQQHRRALLIKRTIDVIGSLFALCALSPLFILLAILVGLTSRGPVLYRQERIGQNGVPFTLYKFRSMQVNRSDAIHQDYVKRFIQGSVSCADDLICFKLIHDDRITRVGRWLRRTSLDEIPQFINVLAGHMSLVGPRPPLRYELRDYTPWHLRRVLEAKPGLTGLWQVYGRSKTSFDEMVRLDLLYARDYSLHLDAKLMWKTIGVVVAGDGAC